MTMYSERFPKKFVFFIFRHVNCAKVDGFHLGRSAPKTEVHFLGLVWSLWYVDPCSIAWQAVTQAQVVEQAAQHDEACWFPLPSVALIPLNFGKLDRVFNKV